MRTINFLGFLFIIVFLFTLYNASEKGAFIFQNSNTHKIKINRDTFEPNDLSINLGDEVIWRSHDYVLRHTVVNDDPILRNSDVLLKGDEFKIIFDRPGEYVFYSSLYPNFQKGIVRVKDVQKSTEYRKKVKTNVLDVVFKLQRIFMKSFKKFYTIIKKLIEDYATFEVYIGLAIIGIFLFIYIFKVQFVVNLNLSIVSGLVLLLGYYYYSKNKNITPNVTALLPKNPLANVTKKFKIDTLFK